MNKEAAAVKLARELGIDAVHSWGKPTPGVELIERFFQAAYAAGADAERKACETIADAEASSWGGFDSGFTASVNIAAAIRARGNT